VASTKYKHWTAALLFPPLSIKPTAILLILHDYMKSNGSWRLPCLRMGFGKDTAVFTTKRFGRRLSAKGSLFQEVLRVNDPCESVMEVLMIQSTPREEVNFFDLPEVFSSLQADIGLWTTVSVRQQPFS